MSHNEICYIYFCPYSLICYYIDQLMQAEEKGHGAVTWAVYATYIKAAGGPLAFIINILLFLLTTGSIAFSNWWLSHWIKQGSGVSGASAGSLMLAIIE